MKRTARTFLPILAAAALAAAAHAQQSAVPKLGEAPAATPAAVPALGEAPRPPAARPDIPADFDAALFDIIPATEPVELYSVGAEAPTLETAAAMLRAGSRVRTVNSRAQMALREKADTIRIPERSEVELVELSGDSEQVQLRLVAGSLWSEVAPRAVPGDFKVVTPDLTAGVKGTRFRVDIIEGQGSLVTVDEGSVEVSSAKAPVSTTLGANQAVLVKLNGQLLEAINIDPSVSREAWDAWAQEATAALGGASLGGGFAAPLVQQIAADNAAWTQTMEEANRTIAENKYLEKMEEVSQAFMRFAADTGHVPGDDEAWNLMKENRAGLDGWNGPYLEGPMPPEDPFGSILVYRKRTPPSGNVNAMIHSPWRDKVDQQGRAPGDQSVIVPFYREPRVREALGLPPEN
ncbi:MAG: FecR domain-containing protein [Candidatus Sumerlaeia bacterium]|nr:FecR domain-containing protein [Candidatus Sumerlaeia bacterium]